MMKRWLLLIMAALVMAVSCTGNPKPETTVARTGNAVLESTAVLQRGITVATDAKQLPVDVARRLTGYSEQVYKASGPLGDALRAYHAATTLDLKRINAAEIQTLLSDINTPLGKMLAETIPGGALQQITALISNVMTAVSNVQHEIAATMGGK